MGRLQDKQFIASSRKRNEKTKPIDTSENDKKKLEAVFCPPLDTSLVEVIWNDNKNYEVSFEILSLLAKEASTHAAADPPPRQPDTIPTDDNLAYDETTYNGSTYDNLAFNNPPNDIVSTKIPDSTSTEEDVDEDSKIQFLKHCFLDQSQQQLETVLRQQTGDLQSTIDVILNNMFLQEEEAEDDNTSEHSDNGKQGSPDRFLDTWDGNDIDSSAKSSKRMQKAQRQARKTQTQRNKKQVIWDSGGLNAASIRSGNYPDPIMLAPIEPNRWLEYDIEGKELTQLFPSLSKTVINTTVRRFRGNLLECVDHLARLTNTPPLHLSLSTLEEHRMLEKIIDQVHDLLHGTDKDEVRRLATGAMLQGRASDIKEIGELSQMVVDLICARERDREKEQIMIEDRLKELALYEKKEITYDPVTGDIVLGEFPMLASERLAAKIKTAQAAKEIRAVPEYLLIDNTDQYVDDNPDECRDIAFDLILQRNEAYRKAATAYRRARGKANGEGGIAFFYSDEGRKMDKAAKDWNMRAARAIVREHRLRQNDDHLLDLHGLTVAEAVELVKEGVNQWWSRSTMRAGRTKIKPLNIVTGLGRHSDHGQSRLYPAVLGLLTREGWKVDTYSRGSIFVTGLSNADKRKL